MHFLKKGQKIRAWVDPPPLIRAMPERKHFYSVDVLPYLKDAVVALSVDLLAWRVSHCALALRLIIVMKLDIGDSPRPPSQNDHSLYISQ